MIVWYAVFSFVGLLSACRSSPPVTFYTLNTQNPAFESRNSPAGRERNLSIGISPIYLPEYLDRPQIVTLKGTHTLHLAEFHRWAAPLDQEIGQVFAKNFIVLLQTSKIIFFPWDSSQRPQYQVDLRFYHFEGILGESFHAQGIWRVTEKEGASETTYKRFDMKIPVSGEGYEDLAEACSESLWRLSRDIGAAIDKNNLK